MAKKKSASTTPSKTARNRANKAVDTVLDAEIVADDANVADTVEAEMTSADVESPTDLDVSDVDSTDLDMTQTDLNDEKIEEMRDEVAPAASPVVEQPSSGGGFLPLLFGGLIAGGIGYGVSYWQNNQPVVDPTALIEAQAAEIDSLKSQIAELANGPDLSPIETGLADVQTTVSTLAEAVTQQTTDLGERIDVLERQPSSDGTLTDTALAAFEADMAGLRDRLAEQQDEMQAMADQTAQQLNDTRAEATAIEANEIAKARTATARSALARIQASLETGAPMGAMLQELASSTDEPIPDALTAATDGVATLASLQDSFPDAARAALATARSEGADGEETSGLGSFLRNQFDVRSVAPKEGNSVDAILSRAEATLKEGRLNDTLAEVAALPEVARAPLSEWVGQAEMRATALDAAASLADVLNIN